jgi:hypothetical protein
VFKQVSKTKARKQGRAASESRTLGSEAALKFMAGPRQSVRGYLQNHILVRRENTPLPL